MTDIVANVLDSASIPHGTVEDQLLSSKPIVALDTEDQIQSAEWSILHVLCDKTVNYAYLLISRSRVFLTVYSAQPSERITVDGINRLDHTFHESDGKLILNHLYNLTYCKQLCFLTFCMNITIGNPF